MAYAVASHHPRQVSDENVRAKDTEMTERVLRGRACRAAISIGSSVLGTRHLELQLAPAIDHDFRLEPRCIDADSCNRRDP